MDSTSNLKETEHYVEHATLCFNCGRAGKCPHVLEKPCECRHFAPYISKSQACALAGLARTKFARYGTLKIMNYARARGIFIKIMPGALWIENYHELKETFKL